MTRPSPKTREKVRERAKKICEYCQSLEKYSGCRFESDHIFPASMGGTNQLENLAFACRGCNAAKDNQVEGFDKVESDTRKLFNPRIDIWTEHFAWSKDFITVIGLTGIGRVTVDVLDLNREGLRNLRELLRDEGKHPPPF